MQRFLKVTSLLLVGLAALAAVPRPVRAASGVASAYYDGRRTIVLGDGTKVTLVRAMSSAGGKREYFYLPTNMHLARNPDGSPQFLFLKFTTEKREDKGGVQGAIMHF